MIIHQARDSPLLSWGTVSSHMTEKSSTKWSMVLQMSKPNLLIQTVDSKITKFVMENISIHLVEKMNKHVENFVRTSLKVPVLLLKISAANMKMMEPQTQLDSVTCTKVLLSKKLRTQVALLLDALIKMIVAKPWKMNLKKNGDVMPGLINLRDLTTEMILIKLKKTNLIEIWNWLNKSSIRKLFKKSHLDGHPPLSLVWKILVSTHRSYNHWKQKELK